MKKFPYSRIPLALFFLLMARSYADRPTCPQIFEFLRRPYHFAEVAGVSDLRLRSVDETPGLWLAGDGSVYEHELQTAKRYIHHYRRHVDAGATLVLASMINRVHVPSVDGVLYDASGNVIADVSLKTSTTDHVRPDAVVRAVRSQMRLGVSGVNRNLPLEHFESIGRNFGEDTAERWKQIYAKFLGLPLQDTGRQVILIVDTGEANAAAFGNFELTEVRGESAIRLGKAPDSQPLPGERSTQEILITANVQKLLAEEPKVMGIVILNGEQAVYVNRAGVRDHSAGPR